MLTFAFVVRIWMECAADNKHFKLVVNGKEYPSKIGKSPR